jgi:hypothetical protein
MYLKKEHVKRYHLNDCILCGGVYGSSEELAHHILESHEDPTIQSVIVTDDDPNDITEPKVDITELEIQTPILPPEDIKRDLDEELDEDFIHQNLEQSMDESLEFGIKNEDSDDHQDYDDDDDGAQAADYYENEDYGSSDVEEEDMKEDITAGKTGIRGGSCNPSYWEVGI